MTNAKNKIEIVSRQPLRNAAGKIDAYICTIREGGIFAGKFRVATTCPYTGKSQRSKKAQIAVIAEMIEVQEARNNLK